MTESALTARLKLQLRRLRPMEGGLGETIAPRFGFTGGWSLKLRSFSLFFASFFASFFMLAFHAIFIGFWIDFGSKNRLKIDEK